MGKQILSDEEVDKLYSKWVDDPDASIADLIRSVEAEVLAKVGAKEEVCERGPWTVDDWRDGRIAIQSQDFTHDVALELSGDFGDPELKRRHAQFICDKLNTSPPEARGVPEGWQPIETAPKDGTLVLLCDAVLYEPRTGCWASFHPNVPGKECWRTSAIGGHRLNPSHWMPLPVSPNRAAAPSPAKEGE